MRRKSYLERRGYVVHWNIITVQITYLFISLFSQRQPSVYNLKVHTWICRLMYLLAVMFAIVLVHKLQTNISKHGRVVQKIKSFKRSLGSLLSSCTNTHRQWVGKSSYNFLKMLSIFAVIMLFFDQHSPPPVPPVYCVLANSLPPETSVTVTVTVTKCDVLSRWRKKDVVSARARGWRDHVWTNQKAMFVQIKNGRCLIFGVSQ